jgi:hypothetical protein
MAHRRTSISCIAVVTMLGAAALAAALEVPFLGGRVNDLAVC